MGGEKSQHPAAGAGAGGRGAAEEATSSGLLPSSAVRSPEWANPKEYG